MLPGLLVVVLLVFGLRETPAAQPPKEPLRLTLQPFDRNFRLYLLALVVFTLGNSSDAFLLVRAGELGVPTALLPLLWCAFHVVKSIEQPAPGPGGGPLRPPAVPLPRLAASTPGSTSPSAWRRRPGKPGPVSWSTPSSTA